MFLLTYRWYISLSFLLMSKMNRRLTKPQIMADFNRGHSMDILPITVKRVLRNEHLCARIAVPKPFLRLINRSRRLRWGEKHKNWTYEVLWTDESKFQIFCQNRRTYVRRSAKEKKLSVCIVFTVKYIGGSILV